jgi:hypothetical protein
MPEPVKPRAPDLADPPAAELAGGSADLAGSPAELDGAAPEGRPEEGRPEEGRPEEGRPEEERPVSDARSPVDLARVAWLLTVATLLTGTVILAIRGDVGYAIVAAAVAASAAINLF